MLRFTHALRRPYSWSALLVALWIMLGTMIQPTYAAEPTAFNNWAKTARLAGAAVWVGMSDAEMDQVISDMVTQNVTVIEADSELSNYLNDEQFDKEIDLMRRFADKAHKKGLRVVWYYPSLEVITPNGKNIEQTMAKEHPDWIQQGIDGVPNVFYGGSGQVFWVELNDESAWMSPSSEAYRNYFIDRIERIVRNAGIDGLWLDVPLYADFGDTKWSDASDAAKARFKLDTGLDTPTEEDWSNPVWRRWMTWRHEEIARFLTDVTQAARLANPEFPIFAETLPTDYNGGTIYGLDGGYLKNVEGLTHIWEVDTMSNTVGMRHAREDDWVSFISALKYTRAASGKKPSWVFSYGKQVDDATQVMAQALISGNNPYELQVPEMTTTVGADFRKNMFDWTQRYSDYLFKSESKANVGVLYSSASRDFVDQFQGLGMFATTDGANDPLWWAESTIDSVYQRDFLAEFRGVIKLLVNQHIPFDTLVFPDLAELQRYQVVVLPNIQAISTQEADIIRQYVQQGGHIIVTGNAPSSMNEHGVPYANLDLADVLGFDNSNIPTSQQNNFGSGKAFFFSDLLGKQYLVNTDSNAQSQLSQAIRSLSTVNLSSGDAGNAIYFELDELNGETIIQMANFQGMDGSFSIVPRSFDVILKTDKTAKNIRFVSPDLPVSEVENLSFGAGDGFVRFRVTVDQYAMAIVNFETTSPSNPVINHTPTAGTDFLGTFVNQAFSFSDAQLLANDGDLDNDNLQVTNVQTTPKTKGSFESFGAGQYVYTPPQNFLGRDELIYNITDGKGETTSAKIIIDVTVTKQRYFPASVTTTIGTNTAGDVNSFKNIDEDTYDIKSELPSLNQRVHHIQWDASVIINEPLEQIGAIRMVHIGEHTKQRIIQKFFAFNFSTNQWDDVGTLSLDNAQEPHMFTVTLNENLANYRAANGELRTRFQATRGGRNSTFTSWSSQFYWEVLGKAPTQNQVPSANFSANCTALSCTFTDGSSDSDGTINSWIWDFGDGQTSSQQNPTHSYAQTGTYTVRLTVTDNQGATHSQEQSLQVSTPSSNTLSNDASNIVVDGGLSDWSTLTAYSNDAGDMGSNPLDWEQAWFANTNERLFFAYRTQNPILLDKLWAYQIYVDTDSNAETGFKVRDVGAEYLIEGRNLYRYTGTNNSWSWEGITAISTSVINSNQAEFSFDYAQIESPDSFRFLFRGNNTALGGDTADYYPNTGFFTYQKHNSSGGGSGNTNITIDGDLSDWASLQNFASDPDDMSGAIDWKQTWAAHDEQHLYFAYRLHKAINVNAAWGYQIFIDTQNTPDMGYNHALKADYLIEGGNLYKYTGTGNDWQWEFVNSAQSQINATDREMQFLRSDLGNPTSLRFMLIGNNAAVGGEGLDIYPNEAFNVNAAQRFLEYNF